jgi:hypothetical protein
MLKHLRSLLFGAALVVGFAGQSLFGQMPAPGTVADEFDRLHFRSIGPVNMSGRISDFAVFEANPAIFYVGTAHGGVWKTTSNGAMFEPQFQNEGLISIGDVTVSQKDPNVVWVGTGEANNRQSTSWGGGVFKSTDGGKTYRSMGLASSRHVGRIVIDPEDNNVVLVAAAGSIFGPGGERGVYKTIDGGATWKQVLKVNDDTGANELVQALTDHRTLYTATYQRRREQCCMNGGGPGSGIWKSTDLGETWTPLKGNGLPTGSMGRIGLDVYRRSANTVYALIEAEGAAGGGGRGGGAAAAGAAGAAGQGGGRGGGGGASGLYRSDDGGATWRMVNANNPRPMYFSQVRIDPNSPDRVYLGGVGLHMTNDAGQSMATDAAQAIHDDIHAIWLDPSNSEHLMIGGDGGVAISYDMSRTWTQLNNLPVSLFYHVGYDMEMPFNVCGGLQDNYNWCGPSATRFTRGITFGDWFQVQGGDGFVAIIDARDSNIIYSESQDGNIRRGNKLTGEGRSIRPGPGNVQPSSNGQNLRFNWDTPMVFSPHDPGVLLVGAQKVFRSTDRGDSWIAISQDLTTNLDRNEVQTMGLMGNQITIARNDGISAYSTIVSLAESPKQAGLIYTGTDDGVASVSKDAGKTWDTKLAARIPGFPKGAWVSEVVPSRFDAGTVYVTVDAHRLNDFKTYIWASSDFGATFRALNANLSDQVVKTLTEDTKNPDVLYIGTETGLFLSIDRGKNWRRLKANLPSVRVDEITIHPRDNAMILATHGRGVFILDHLEPIQEYAAAQSAAADARLFSIPTALMWKSKDQQNDEFWGHAFFTGENPPTDAVIQYSLKRAATDVKLNITDPAGKLIRELTVAGARLQPGIQTTCWDFRMPGIAAPPAVNAPAAGGGAGARGGGRAGAGGAGAAGAQFPGGGRGAGGPGGGLTGIPGDQPVSGYLPANPCAGVGGAGGGRGGGGGGGFPGFGGGAGGPGPHVAPGTYNVALVIDGKLVETKPIKVVLDPGIKWQGTQQKQYFDLTADLHEMERRGSEVAGRLQSLYDQMAGVAAKVKDGSNVLAATKTQFDVFNKDFDALRAKFGVPLSAGGGGGGRGGGGGGGGRGGAPGAAAPPTAPPPGQAAAPADDGSADLLGRAGAAKNAISGIWEWPSDALLREYNAVKLGLPKAMIDANAFLVRATAMSVTLKKNDITLNVPAPVK